jgi:hypothetical protein
MFRLTTYVLLACGLKCLGAGDLRAQSAFDYLRQALVRTVAFSGLMYDYDYKEGLCLAGVLLNEDEYRDVSFYFEGGTRYRIVGIADEDVRDCDLFLYDNSGNEITKDARTDNMPILHYQPTVGGNRTIRLKNYKSSNVSFCILVVMKYRYFGCEPRSALLAEALSNAIRLAAISSLAGTTFAPRTWCLFGGLYSSGQADGMVNFHIGSSGDYVFLGAGSNNVHDVDVFGIQQASVGSRTGSTICQDNSSDRAALASCYLSNYGNYYMSYQNYESQGDAFIFGVVLKQ